MTSCHAGGVTVPVDTGDAPSRARRTVRIEAPFRRPDQEETERQQIVAVQLEVTAIAVDDESAAVNEVVGEGGVVQLRRVDVLHALVASVPLGPLAGEPPLGGRPPRPIGQRPARRGGAPPELGVQP